MKVEELFLRHRPGIGFAIYALDEGTPIIIEAHFAGGEYTTVRAYSLDKAVADMQAELSRHFADEQEQEDVFS